MREKNGGRGNERKKSKLSCSTRFLASPSVLFRSIPTGAISLNVVLLFNSPPEMLIGYILILQFDRLWAEVFHVSTSSAGTVRWQQISEDLVPVNISCIQDHPDYVFHITAYNSQVDKILDVRLNQPGRELLMAFPH